MKRLRTLAASLTFILVVALALRSGFAWNYQRSKPDQALGTIPFLFEPGNIADSLATGNGFGSPFRVDTGPTAWMTPVYPLLLAGIFRCFGIYTFGAFVAAVALNILFSTLTCVPVFFAGNRLGGLGLGAGAAWLWAVFPNAILIPIESLWDASLSALLAATLLWMTLTLADSGRMRDWCRYGILWGFTAMTNATLLMLLPFLLAWAAYRSRRQERSWMRGPAVAAGIVILCCVPWTIRNYAVFHRFVPLRSVLGLSLWLGNNPQAEDLSVGQLHPIDNSAERDKYVEMGEIAYNREKRVEAIQFMLAHPATDASFILHRFLAFWSGGTPRPLTDLLRTRSWWFRFIELFNLLAALGGLMGILLLIKRGCRYAFPLAVWPIVFPCAYYLTLATPRYRLPIDPMVLLLSAVALHVLIDLRSSSSRNINLPGYGRVC